MRIVGKGNKPAVIPLVPRRVASYGTAAVLLTLGLLVLTKPPAIPGLTTPSDTRMEQMSPMSPM